MGIKSNYWTPRIEILDPNSGHNCMLKSHSMDRIRATKYDILQDGQSLFSIDFDFLFLEFLLDLEIADWVNIHGIIAISKTYLHEYLRDFPDITNYNVVLPQQVISRTQASQPRHQ